MGLFNMGKKRFPTNASFRITQSGTDEIQDYEGDAKSQILAALQSRGTSDIEEISMASGLSRGAVEKAMPKLIRNGWVQLAGGGMGEGD